VAIDKKNQKIHGCYGTNNSMQLNIEKKHKTISQEKNYKEDL